MQTSPNRRSVARLQRIDLSSEVAATLVDTLLPKLPYRQWVFTYPIAMRLAMACDPPDVLWLCLPDR